MKIGISVSFGEKRRIAEVWPFIFSSFHNNDPYHLISIFKEKLAIVYWLCEREDFMQNHKELIRYVGKCSFTKTHFSREAVLTELILFSVTLKQSSE